MDGKRPPSCVVTDRSSLTQAPTSFLIDFAAQQYGMLSKPNMKDIHDKNLSFFSPQPFFIAGFFFPQQLFQLAWLYRLYKLDPKKPGERGELDGIGTRIYPTIVAEPEANPSKSTSYHTIPLATFASPVRLKRPCASKMIELIAFQPGWSSGIRNASTSPISSSSSTPSVSSSTSSQNSPP